MPRKILHELRIRSAKNGVGHVVEHHHDEDHDPESHRFKGRNQAAAHILSNLERLEPRGGLPHPPVGEREGPVGEREGLSRPASFDYGSARGRGISGGRK